MSQTDAYTDVVELCALLQCLGFSVKSLDTSYGNLSQDGGARTVVINCQSSGLHVVLESASLSCSCPANNQQNSGMWQVSGITGGKQLDKEFGCTLLGSLPKSHRDRLTKELREMIRCIKDHNESDLEKPKDKEMTNKSASMLELKTPEKKNFILKPDTPNRYRSLDTLTAGKAGADQPLPAPGPLLRPHLVSESSVDDQLDKKTMCRRQSTYTLSSTPGSMRLRNKTSSPIRAYPSTMLDNLISAERTAEDLRNKLAFIIKEVTEDVKNDSSISSLALDVSKISVLKGAETSKAQFASSPNLSNRNVKEDYPKTRLQRFESVSTSNLGSSKSAASKDGRISKLRRISPNIFKLKKDSPSTKIDKGKTQDLKGSKLNSLFRPKIITPVRIPRATPEQSPNLSSSKKKFSHVKSTIPRPAKKE